MGKLRASIKGDALYGTVCGRDYTLTLTTADQFGNPRYWALGLTAELCTATKMAVQYLRMLHNCLRSCKSRSRVAEPSQPGISEDCQIA